MEKIANFLTYYHKTGTEPFRTLSILSDDEMLAIMQAEFPEDQWFHKNPQQRIAERRTTEAWLRQTFIERGGQPTLTYPLYMVLGTSDYIEEYTGFAGSFSAISVPLAEFDASTISFTYPDSVISKRLMVKRHSLYNSAYHGKLFLLSEIFDLVSTYQITGQEWRQQPARKFDYFVKAQIWDDTPLSKYG